MIILNGCKSNLQCSAVVPNLAETYGKFCPAKIVANLATTERATKEDQENWCQAGTNL